MKSHHPKQHLLEVKTIKGVKIIPASMITYIKTENKGSMIYLDNYELIKTNYLLKWYCTYLLAPEFFRCHNSYIVNCQFVDCFCSNVIILKENKRIPLSRNKKESFKRNLMLFQKKFYCQ